jgi:hypothetical protein
VEAERPPARQRPAAPAPPPAEPLDPSPRSRTASRRSCSTADEPEHEDSRQPCLKSDPLGAVVWSVIICLLLTKPCSEDICLVFV